MTKTAPKNKTAVAMANMRWKKTKSPEARRAATAAATAARWATREVRCLICKHAVNHPVHDASVTGLSGHGFVTPNK